MTKEHEEKPKERSAKRNNELVKEIVSYVRGIALGIIVFGAVRAGLDPSAWVGLVRFVISVIGGLAVEALGLYILDKYWREE